jgi:hypothetical protein
LPSGERGRYSEIHDRSAARNTHTVAIISHL